MTTEPAEMADLIRSTPPVVPFDNHAHADTVIEMTARLFNIPAEDIFGPSRRDMHVHPRMVAMAVVRATTRMSLHEIGREFDRDHTTVMSALSTVAASPMLLAWAAAVDAAVLKAGGRSDA